MTCAPIIRITGRPLRRAAIMRSTRRGQVGVVERRNRSIERQNVVQVHVVLALGQRAQLELRAIKHGDSGS